MPNPYPVGDPRWAAYEASHPGESVPATGSTPSTASPTPSTDTSSQYQNYPAFMSQDINRNTNNVTGQNVVDNQNRVQTGGTDTNTSGLEVTNQSNRKYVDIPTPEQFMDDFHNGFATHVQNMFHQGSIPLLAANWMMEHENLFLARYLGTLGNMAAQGQPIFKVIGANATPTLLGSRQGDVTSSLSNTAQKVLENGVTQEANQSTQQTQSTGTMNEGAQVQYGFGQQGQGGDANLPPSPNTPVAATPNPNANAGASGAAGGGSPSPINSGGGSASATSTYGSPAFPVEPQIGPDGSSVPPAFAPFYNAAQAAETAVDSYGNVMRNGVLVDPKHNNQFLNGIWTSPQGTVFDPATGMWNAPTTPEQQAAVQQFNPSLATGVTVPGAGGAGGFGQNVNTRATTIGLAGVNTRQNTSTSRNITNSAVGSTNRTTNTNEDIYGRPNLTTVHTLAPLDFLQQNATPQDAMIMYEGMKYAPSKNAAQGVQSSVGIKDIET